MLWLDSTNGSPNKCRSAAGCTRAWLFHLCPEPVIFFFPMNVSFCTLRELCEGNSGHKRLCRFFWRHKLSQKSLSQRYQETLPAQLNYEKGAGARVRKFGACMQEG